MRDVDDVERRALWRTWKSRSKCGSSTQNGWSSPKGTSRNRRRKDSSRWRRLAIWSRHASWGVVAGPVCEAFVHREAGHVTKLRGRFHVEKRCVET